MQPGSSYSLIAEMLETPGLIGRFEYRQGAAWAKKIEGKKKLFLTGEGASRIFPAKNLMHLAPPSWHIRTEGARQAAEYDLTDFVVIGASNSGRTRELISLFEKLPKENIYGVTATPGSRLTELCECRVLTCGPEKAIAATKSFIEQALVYQSLLQGEEWKNQNAAADACEEILTRELPASIIDAVSAAPQIYFAGRNNGVAEQLALMTNEIARQKSLYLEGTYVLHGVEEVMQQGEVIILVEPFREEIEQYRSILQERANMTVMAIASFDTPFPTIKIPVIAGFEGYLQLMAGWNLLVAAGLAKGIDLDKARRARKVGNAFPDAGL